MKKRMIVMAIAFVLGIGYLTLEADAQMGPGMMGPGMMGPGYGYGPPQEGDWNYCPYCGGPIGPGMMGRGMGDQPTIEKADKLAS